MKKELVYYEYLLYKLVGILILDICVYKYLDTKKKKLSLMTKFVIGLVLAFTAICFAGTVEIFRRNQCDPGIIKDEKNILIIIV